MKLISCLLVLILSGIATANITETSSNDLSKILTPPLGSSIKDGFYIGFDYMNLTDYHLKGIHTNNVTGEQTIDTNVFGYHIGTVGLALGYTETNGGSIGFKVGIRFLETINPSETRSWITSKFNIVVPEGNLTYSLNSYLTSYLGLNYCVFNGARATNDFRGRLGGQFGLGIHFAKQLTLNLGYSILVQGLNQQDDLGRYGSYGISSELQASGFNTNLVYIF